MEGMGQGELSPVILKKYAIPEDEVKKKCNPRG
jgi:hypothetical protein